MLTGKEMAHFTEMMPEVHICWSLILHLQFLFTSRSIFLPPTLWMHLVSGTEGLTVNGNYLVKGIIIMFLRDGTFPLFWFLSSFGSFFIFSYCVGGCLIRSCMSLIIFLLFCHTEEVTPSVSAMCLRIDSKYWKNSTDYINLKTPPWIPQTPY